MSKRAQTITPPDWWVSLVGSLVRTGRGQAGLPDGVWSQRGIAIEVAARFGVHYDPSEISRCISGQVVPAQMAEQISLVLEIPPPVFVALSRDEAERFVVQRTRTLQLRQAGALEESGTGTVREQRIGRARAAVDAEVRDLEVRIGRRQSKDQTSVVDQKSDEEARRRRGSVGRVDRRGAKTPS